MIAPSGPKKNIAVTAASTPRSCVIVREQADSEIADDRESRKADNQAKQSCKKSAHAFPFPSHRPNVRCYVGEVELRGAAVINDLPRGRAQTEGVV